MSGGIFRFSEMDATRAEADALFAEIDARHTVEEVEGQTSFGYTEMHHCFGVLWGL